MGTPVHGLNSQRWHDAHATARALHDALLMLGIPETELVTMTARDDPAGQPAVHIPRLTPASARLLLTALGPALGPPRARPTPHPTP